jgi:two-component system OmpR family response regulator
VRVLVIEDEVKLASLIRKALREQGMLADVAITGEDALWMAAATPYDVLVLDVNCPGWTDSKSAIAYASIGSERRS